MPRRCSSYSLVSSRATAAGAGAEHGRGVGEHLGQPLRRFEQDQRRRHRRQLAQDPPARGAARRQEALEQEPVGRQAGGHQRRQHGRGAGDREDGAALGQRRAHQLEAGIGDRGRAGVADQGHRLARREPGQQLRPRRLGIVLVVERQRPAQAQMAHQPAGHPAVLADHEVGGGEHALGAPGQVLEIADRRRDEIEARRRVYRGFRLV